MAIPRCPRCGGEGTRLASGYYRCGGTILVNVIPPGAQGNIGPVPLYEPCATRFQTSDPGGPVRQCACGFYAVGGCTSCGKPLCGKHAVDFGERLLCAEDAHAERETKRRAAEEMYRRQAEERRRAVSEWGTGGCAGLALCAQ